jgi:uncharacterized radical SAM superfamily protein
MIVNCTYCGKDHDNSQLKITRNSTLEFCSFECLDAYTQEIVDVSYSVGSIERSKIMFNKYSNLMLQIVKKALIK